MPILGTPGDVDPLIIDDAWAGFSEMTWTGWDGTEWDLLGKEGGVFILDDGCRGLNMPPIDRFVDESPAVAGSRWRGHRITEREVFWPFFLFRDGGSVAWLDYDRSWWATMRPDRLGTWSIVGPGGEQRDLSLRFVDDDDHVITVDPMTRGWQTYGLRFVAEDPFWTGQPVRRTWENSTPTSFFGGSIGGSGTPLMISSGSTVATAEATNLGDVSAWPIWEIQGPATSVTVGVGGNSLTWTGSLSAVNRLTIDTKPSKRTVIDETGANRIAGLNAAAKFGEIPAGQSVPLVLSLAGAGSISMTIRPQFYRAW